MDTTTHWLSINYGWLFSLLIQGFIAYHVFFLSNKLSNRAKLEHKEAVKKMADELLLKIGQKQLSRKVYLVNIDRYFKDYPSNKEKIFDSYSHIKAEIKATRFDGIQFFSDMPVEIYKNQKGKLSLKGHDKAKVYNAFPVSTTPYEWIEHIDLEGDEYAYVPLIYCHFKGKTNWKFWKRLLFFRYPYKYTDYYKKNESYSIGEDPADWEYNFIDKKIHSK